MNVFQGEAAERPSRVPSSRKLWTLLLQVRCVVYNGTFGSEFGQRFVPANDTHPRMAVAA
jgi:hypothetical protein